jgi:hypothetical protein
MPLLTVRRGLAMTIRGPIRGAALTVAATLLAACEHAPPAQIPTPPRQVETGSTFLLRAPLAFPPGSSELLFQNEQIVPPARLSQAMPYCKLAPDAGAPGAIPPGRFTVRAVSYDEREIGTTSRMTSVTRIALSADPGRPGYALSCGWPEGAPAGGFVTTEQIFNAIGGQFSMNLLR